MTSGRPTALRIPCPRNQGDDDGPMSKRYRLWCWLYVWTRRLRHKMGMHDWVRKLPLPGYYRPNSRCTWCGRIDYRA